MATTFSLCSPNLWLLLRVPLSRAMARLLSCSPFKSRAPASAASPSQHTFPHKAGRCYQLSKPSTDLRGGGMITLTTRSHHLPPPAERRASQTQLCHFTPISQSSRLSPARMQRSYPGLIAELLPLRAFICRWCSAPWGWLATEDLNRHCQTAACNPFK